MTTKKFSFEICSEDRIEGQARYRGDLLCDSASAAMILRSAWESMIPVRGQVNEVMGDVRQLTELLSCIYKHGDSLIWLAS